MAFRRRTRAPPFLNRARRGRGERKRRHHAGGLDLVDAAIVLDRLPKIHIGGKASNTTLVVSRSMAETVPR